MSIELPPLYKTEMDAAGLAALLDDLAVLPGGVEARLKRSARGQVGEGTIALDQARRALLEGADIRGAQFTYHHDGELWRDTVMCRGDRFVVVRMAVQAPRVGDTRVALAGLTHRA